MFQTIEQLLIQIDHFVWGIPLIALILCGGIMLTVRMGFLQIRKLPLALKWMVASEEDGEGEVSSFQALCTALSATIGTGNIVGVATAVTTGGPGAIFWLNIAALFGMATKYAEGLLAIKYRTVDKNGHALGGPFYYIERGMGARWKPLAKLFAFFGVCVGTFGTGTFTQVNGISSAVANFFDPKNSHLVSIPHLGTYNLVVVISAILLTISAALVLLGGLKRIAQVTEVIVPFMAVAYIASVVVLMVTNASAIPQAIKIIIEGAFNPRAVTGGAIGSMMIVMQTGIARGVFSNEAGLGSAPIAAAAAKTKEPVRQGLVSMTGTFIDTILICTMTGLSIVITGAWKMPGLKGVTVTSYAFSHGLPFSSNVAAFILMMCLVFFAFTTILGWNYYSERCLEYLTPSKKANKIFKYVYIFNVFIGSFISLSTVWTISDIFNGLMAIPNMIAIFALSGVIVEETKRFFKESQESLEISAQLDSYSDTLEN